MIGQSNGKEVKPQSMENIGNKIIKMETWMR